MNWIGIGKWVALAAAVLLLVQWIRDDGATSVRNAIERQNHEAGNAANNARLSRRQCVDAGGVFHFETGKCAGAQGDGRQ